MTVEKSGHYKPTPAITEQRLDVFAGAIMEGSTQTAAYRRIHPPSEKWKPETVRKKATVWAAQGKVLARLDDFRKATRKNCITNVQLLDGMHKEAFEVARNNNNPSAMTTAAKNLAQLHGLEAPKQVDVTLTIEQRAWEVADGMTVDELETAQAMIEQGASIVEAVRRIAPERLDTGFIPLQPGDIKVTQ